MKTRFERYCELRSIDNWLLRNPGKAYVVSAAVALVILALSQLLKFAVDWTAARLLP